MHKQESAFSLWKSGWCSPPNNSPPLSCFKSSCLWLLHINKKEIFLSYSLISKFYCTNCKVRLFKNTVFENHITCLISNFPVKYISIMLIFGTKIQIILQKETFWGILNHVKKGEGPISWKKILWDTRSEHLCYLHLNWPPSWELSAYYQLWEI